MNPAETECFQAITLAARWTVLGQSAVKPSNDRFTIAGSDVWRSNEDRFRIYQTTDALLAAVADGAGASGLYCGAWAEALVSRVPIDPITELKVLDSWMAGFCLEFGRTRVAAADGRHRTKLVREGSCSTLTACWLRSSNAGCHLDWLGFGDSPLLLLEQTECGEYALIDWHPRPLSLLQQDPQLLNWKDVPTAAGFRSGAILLPRRCCIVLATDAIGLYLLTCYSARTHENEPTPAYRTFLQEFGQLSGKTGGRRDLLRTQQHPVAAATFATEIASLRQSLRSEESFAAWLFRRYKDGLVANDDATVIIIDVEIPDPEPAPPPTPPDEAAS